MEFAQSEKLKCVKLHPEDDVPLALTAYFRKDDISKAVKNKK